MVNIWPNTGFENSTEPWAALNGSDAPVLDDTQVFMGNSALYCRKGAGTTQVYAAAQADPYLTAGAQDYDVSVWLYVPPTIIGRHGFRVGGNGTTQQTLWFDQREQWTRVTATFTWDGVGTVWFYTIAETEGEGECWLDQLRVDDGTTVEPIAPTAVAEIQTVDPPRVQVTVTGLAGLGANLITPNPGFEEGFTGWTTIPADAEIVIPANWEPPDVGEGEPEPEPPPDPTEGDAYAHSAGGGTFSRDIEIASLAEVAGSIAVLGAEESLITFTLTLLIDGQPDPDASPATDQVVPDPTAWQSMDLTLLAGPAHTAVRFTVESTGEMALDNANLSSATLPDTITLFRVEEESGNRVPVRGFYEVPAQNSLIAIDYGAPVNEPIHYEVVGYSDLGPRTLAVSNTIIIPATEPWLTNPITGAGVSATILSWNSMQRAARTAIVPVAGRAGPIVLSDKRLLPNSELVLLTRTREQLMQLREVLADGDVLQIRPPCEAVEHQYIAIGDVVESRLSEGGSTFSGGGGCYDPWAEGKSWAREVSLICQQVDQPSPNIPAVGDTLLDLYNYLGEGSTLLDLSEMEGPDTTWLDVASANLSMSTMRAGI